MPASPSPAGGDHQAASVEIDPDPGRPPAPAGQTFDTTARADGFSRRSGPPAAGAAVSAGFQSPVSTTGQAGPVAGRVTGERLNGPCDPTRGGRSPFAPARRDEAAGPTYGEVWGHLPPPP
jgi:hypothetical protein